MTAKSAGLEVEEKFVVPSDIDERLIRYGFVRQQRREMTDWYFDTSSLQLLQQNVWLRYRQAEKQEQQDDVDQWEIKVGQPTLQGDSNASATTVYMEMEGRLALRTAASFIIRDDSSSSNNNTLTETFLVDNNSLFVNQTVPQIPVDDGLAMHLVPLARIYTCRTSWRNSDLNVVVDLDETDFGHAVGEVEMILYNDAHIDAARAQVREWATKLQEPTTSGSSVAMGKLEYYFFHYRPRVYDVCLQCGVLG